MPALPPSPSPSPFPSGATRLAAALALAAAFVLALALGALAGPSGARAQAGESPCEAEVTKVAAPRVLQLGETTRVTLTLQSVCPAELAPIDVMLVIDQSASMADDEKLVNAKRAAERFVAEMDFPQSRVGLVAFNHDAGIRSPLSDQPGPVEAAIDSLIAGGQTNVSGAMDIARQHLEERADPDRAQAMVVLTDGRNTVSGADPIPEAAQRAKAAGIVVATFCAGGDCDPDLEPAASTPDLYFNVTDTSRLVALYAELAGQLQRNALRSITVVDIVPANMRFLGGTGSPEPDDVDYDRPDGTTALTWRLGGAFPPDGLSYDLEPLEEGVHPTNVTAVADFVDRKGLSGQVPFPVPEVEVLVPPCLPRPLEVYFLIDDSTCLLNSRLNGMAAVEAIALGVGEVADQMKLGRDTAAVIGFGDTAEIYQELTTDRDAIVDAARRVAMRDGAANLDLAYDEVRRELRSSRHRPRAQVVTVTVTDGPMMAAPRRAEARADQLRAAGALHYNIGVGPIVQQTLLRAIAEPGGYRYIDLDDDVIGAYVELGQMFTPLGDDCVPIAELTPSPPAPPTATPSPGPTPAVFRGYLPRLGNPE